MGHDLLQLLSHPGDHHVLPKHQAEGENPQEAFVGDGEVHPERAGPSRPQHLAVVELQIQREVTLLSALLLLQDADVQVLPVYLPDRFQLPDDVAEVALPLGGVVEHHALGGLVLADEGRGSHLGVAEAEVFVEVVQSVQKVSHVSAQHPQESGVAIATYVLHEILPEHHHYGVAVLSQLWRRG